MANISRFVETKLRLKVNAAKSAGAQPWQRKFLGFSFSGPNTPHPARRIAPQALERFRQRVREMTWRRRGVSIEQTVEELGGYLTGWRGYFGFCETLGSSRSRQLGAPTSACGYLETVETASSALSRIDAPRGSPWVAQSMAVIDAQGMLELYQPQRNEFFIALATAATVAVVRVMPGISVAVVLSLIAHVRHSYRLRTRLLMRDAAGEWRMVPVAPGIFAAPGVIVYRFEADPVLRQRGPLYGRGARALVGDHGSRTRDRVRRVGD